MSEHSREKVWKKFLRDFYHKLPSPPSTNYMFKMPQNPYGLLSPKSVIFDIGSKDVRGVYAFGAPPQDAKLVCVDIEPSCGVDLVADAQDMHMIESESVDCVIIVGVLMNLKYPEKAIQEILRILKPNGIIYASVSFIFPFTQDPYDFYRWSPDGIKILCAGFECIESGFNRGPASTMCHLLVHFLAILFSFNSRRLYGINIDLFKWLLFWIKYLDVFLGKYQMAKVIHSGVYFLGKKAHFKS